jgi:pilus assembly protein CpaB
MLKGKTPLIIALVLGLAAGAVSYGAIKVRERQVRDGWNLIPVVVANVDIPEGTVITIDMIAQRGVPEQFVTSSVVKPESSGYVVGQKVLVALQAGDPLLWSQFETTKSAERLSSKVQKKGRAFTIDVTKTAAVGGWVRPNDKVDVLGTFRDPQSNEMVAVTLLQNIIVLATGKITGTTNVSLIPENQRDYQNVSLLVLPEEAEVLALAADLGELRLSLRHEEDVDSLDERGRATIGTLLSGQRTRELEEKRRRVIIDVIRGSGTERAAPVAGPSTP